MQTCELLKVSRAAFYQHMAGPSAHERADAALTVQITEANQESKGRYGAPRVHAYLAEGGHRHRRKRVGRLMRTAACGAGRLVQQQQPEI
jgi:hypothetical protein